MASWSSRSSGFGPSGEGYLRLTAFGQRAQVEEAVERITRPVWHCNRGRVDILMGRLYTLMHGTNHFDDR
jgi:hypothetical protein